MCFYKPILLNLLEYICICSVLAHFSHLQKKARTVTLKVSPIRQIKGRSHLLLLKQSNDYFSDILGLYGNVLVAGAGCRGGLTLGLRNLR